MTNFLVINLGLRSIRAVVFNEKGEKLAQKGYLIKTIIENGRVEQDPSWWWILCQKAIKGVLKDRKIRNSNLAITVTSSSCCLVLIDKKGNPIGNALMVSDKRSKNQASFLSQDKRFCEIFSASNNLPVASYMMPKIMWLKENEPVKFFKTWKFLSSNDYLIFKLTGRLVTDPLNAEKFYYNQETKSYPEPILSFLGINKDYLPDVWPIGSNLGSLRKELKKELEINGEAEVILSTYDAICAFWGSGVHKEGQACNVCGTSSSFRVYSKKQPKLHSGLLSQHFDQIENVHIVGGSNNLDGGLFEWAKGVFYGEANSRKDVYKKMEAEALKSPPGSSGIVFSPYLLGERVPFFDTKARGMFFGLERHHSREDLIRSVFESSGFLTMSIMETIEALNIPVNQIRTSGGLARNELVSQIRADITGKEVLLMEEVETTALGAYMILALAQGRINSFETASSMVKVKKIFTPNPVAHKKYQHIYRFFKDLREDTKIIFAKRDDLLEKMKKVKEDDRQIIRNL